MPKTVMLSLSSVNYLGDNLGDDFFFIVRLRDFLTTFEHRLRHGVGTTLNIVDTGVRYSYDDAEISIQLPVAALAVERERSSAGGESPINLKSDDAGLGAGVIDIDFTAIAEYPQEYFYYLSIPVQGDFMGKGRERGKIAQLELAIQVLIEWDQAQYVNPGERVIRLYEMGHRSFSGEVMYNIFLKEAVLPGIDLTETNLLFGNFDRADLYRADLLLAILNGASVRDANLERSNLSEVNAQDTHFDRSNLKEADLSYIRLQGSMLRVKASNADFTGAEISASNFRGADLSGARFVNAKISWTDFRDANLSGADFTGATIENIDYSGADITGVINLNVPSVSIDPVDPFEGKSEEYKLGYEEGYQRGYPDSTNATVYDAAAWERSLLDNFPGATTDFMEGYRIGYMFSYDEGFGGG